MRIFEIPNKLTVDWNEEAKAIIDTWTTYFVTLDEFKEAVMVKGVNHAKAHGGKAWIVDSHQATGAFSLEIQKYIETEVFKKFAEIGIKYFMAINSEDAMAKLTVDQYTSQVGPAGMKLLMGSSAQGAIEWLKTH